MKAIIASSSIFVILLLALSGCRTAQAQQNKSDVMVRIAEIEIHKDSLPAYKAILQEEAEASIRLEPGVICIFPMYQQTDSTQIRLLEIYADKNAYEAHIRSPHFQKYKTSTLSMVKSLALIDMKAIDPATLKTIFKKMR